MADTLLVAHRLNEAIRNCQWKGFGVKGFLIGPNRQSSTIVAVWKNDVTNVNNVDQDIAECLTYFPCGKSVIGLIVVLSEKASASFQSGNQDAVEQDLVHLFGGVDTMVDKFDFSPLIMGLYKTGKEESLPVQPWETFFCSVTKSGIKPMQVNVSHSISVNVGMKFRLKANIPLLLSFSSGNAEEWRNQLEESCIKLDNSFQAGSYVFGFDDNRVLVHQGGVILSPDFKSWKTVKDIRKYLKEVADQREEKVSGPTNTQRPVDISLLQAGSDTANHPAHAPIIAHRKGSLSSIQLRLPIDVLVEVKDDLSVQRLYTMLIASVSRQITAMSKCLKTHCGSGRFYTPQVVHVKPTCIQSPVSVIYPKEMAEEDLKSERLALHDRLLLQEDRPYLRKACAEIFLSPTAPGGYLVNPHVGLAVPQSVKNGVVATVDGCYSYHHYMQDRFNDDKWGCAYRSLQTIVSWFKYQGYTNKGVPSHKEIQQALYECGDKGQKFVGSRQWIGSFEVSYVLDHLLGVSCKISNVNCGAELSSKGQELLSHFQSQGTPVMIGGGVLAHTILGVAYDQMTGDIAFLILDPHYTGGEDLKLIQDKGWCGWKDMKFWDQTAHYNMCLPYTPAAV